MQYSVKELADMAGVSARTLRYYDEIGLLCPQRSLNEYRLYGEKEVDRLQHILFYREFGMGLDEINCILDMPSFNRLEALKEHRRLLLREKNRVLSLIANLEKTIDSLEGKTTMQDKEKFEGFKEELIENNENAYGKEIRERYGEAAVEGSYRKIREMDPAAFAQYEKLEGDILKALQEAMEDENKAGPKAQHAVLLHRKWLEMFWHEYSCEAHAGLAEMYVQDERFHKYYEDKAGPGAAEFLRDAILAYVKKAK